MKKTKERILNTALKLFNSDGLSKVTLRTIAKEMGISQGNLNYHYKKREDIIEALYFKLVEKIDLGMSSLETETVNLHSLFNVSHHIMNSSFAYRFFLLDFTQIIRENKTIKQHYSNLVQIREQQFAMIIQFLVNNKIMREEKLPNEYVTLYKRFHILGDFWISSAEIQNKKISKKIIPEYAEIITQAIFPYLTAKGEKEYHSFHIK